MHVALHRKRRGGKQSPLCLFLEASLIRHRHDIGDHAAAGNKAAPGRAGRADADGDFGIGLREDHAVDFHITVSGLVRHRGKAGAACRRRNALIHEGRLRGGHGGRLRAICGAAGKKACRKAKRGRQSDPFFHRLFPLVLCHWPARVPGPPGSRRSRRAPAPVRSLNRRPAPRSPDPKVQSPTRAVPDIDPKPQSSPSPCRRRAQARAIGKLQSAFSQPSRKARLACGTWVNQ